MATPVFVADEVVTAAKMNLLPKGLLAAPSSITSNSSAFTTEADITGLSVTVTLTAARAIKIVFDFGLQSSVTGDNIAIRIKESTTVLKRGDYRIVASASVESHNLEAIVQSPSTGSHTYKISAQRLTGSGSCLVVGTADGRHSSIWVEDIGGDPSV